jgi:hypothetical protein
MPHVEQRRVDDFGSLAIACTDALDDMLGNAGEVIDPSRAGAIPPAQSIA